MSNCKICGNESGKNVRCVVCTWDKSRDFTLHRSLAFLSEKSVEQYFAEKEKAEGLAQEAEEQTQKGKTSRRSGWKSQSFWGRKNRVKAERGQEESRQSEESTVPEVTEIPKNPEFEEILKKAEVGDTEAQYSAAYRYKVGYQTKKDMQKAFYWYMQAANGGDVTAQRELAGYYENGQGGVEKNLEMALRWYKRAASQGDWKAKKEAERLQLKIAIGSQKIQNEKKAETEEERQEKAEKAYQKAIGYKYGIGETSSSEEYKKWCEIAAEYGNCRALFELGDIYERGIGVKMDKKTALVWYQKIMELPSTQCSSLDKEVAQKRIEKLKREIN